MAIALAHAALRGTRMFEVFNHDFQIELSLLSVNIFWIDFVTKYHKVDFIILGQRSTGIPFNTTFKVRSLGCLSRNKIHIFRLILSCKIFLKFVEMYKILCFHHLIVIRSRMGSYCITIKIRVLEYKWSGCVPCGWFN